jgi:hypothetical protein
MKRWVGLSVISDNLINIGRVMANKLHRLNKANRNPSPFNWS